MQTNVELGERAATAFGLIKLSGKEQIFAIDGQHRVEGIKAALEHEDSAELAKEDGCSRIAAMVERAASV